MTEQNTNINVTDVLKTIQRASNTFSYEVWVPSLNREVPFKEISTSQQKRLLKSIIDSEVYNTEFIMTLYDIINENCSDATVNVSELDIIDKLFIALKMRSVSVGNTVDITLTSTKDESIEINSKIDISKLLQKTKKTVKQLKPSSKKYEIYTITCGIPSILDEYKLESEVRAGSEDLEIDNYDELRKSIGEKFLGETSKYIKTLKIEPEGEEPTVVDFNRLTFKERIQIIESLPARCVEHVLDYIGKVEKEMEKVTVYTGSYTHKDASKEEFNYTLSIDGGFFMPS